MLLHQRGQGQLHHVALHQCKVGVLGHRLRQHGVQAAVQLHRHHLSRPAGQLCGEGADAGAYLHHAGIGVRTAGGGDILRHPALNEKILSQRLGEAEAVPCQQSLYVVAVTEIHSGTPLRMCCRYCTIFPADVLYCFSERKEVRPCAY